MRGQQNAQCQSPNAKSNPNPEWLKGEFFYSNTPLLQCSITSVFSHFDIWILALCFGFLALVAYGAAIGG
jgi:hypothetical protein